MPSPRFSGSTYTATSTSLNPEFHKALSTEIKSGFFFEENGVRIEAFEVEHGEIRPAFGYKITTPDKTMRFGKYHSSSHTTSSELGR